MSLWCGILKSFSRTQSKINDRFVLGGATTLRGFQMWGMGPRCHGEATAVWTEFCFWSFLPRLCPNSSMSFHFIPFSLSSPFLSVSHTLFVGYSLGGDAYWATGLHVFAPLPFTSGEFFGRIRMHAFTTAGNLIPLSELVLLREQLIIIGHRKCDVQHKPCYLPPEIDNPQWKFCNFKHNISAKKCVQVHL